MIDTAALREKVLDLAIRGKLVPQDPNDEPASVLLERIRAQKLQMVKEGKLKAKDIKDDTIIFKGDDNCHYEKFADGTIKNIQEEIPFELPDGWCWCRIGSVFLTLTGSTPSTKDKSLYGSDYPFYKPADLDNGANVISSNDTVSNKGYLSARPLPELSVLVTCIGATIGKTGLIKKAGICNQQINAILPNKFIFAEYIYYAMSSSYEQTQIKSNSAATTLPIINKSSFDKLLIPIPPKIEQISIIKKIEEAYVSLDTIDKFSKEIDSIKSSLKSKILELAIQGKLVEQDENDEPASVLLEHIRAEKKAQLGKKYVESYIYKGDDNCYYEKVGKAEPVLVEDLPFDIPDNWTFIRLENALIYEQPTEYIVDSTDYNNAYPIPVLTAGKSFIIGYTNEEYGIKTDLPVIIFDDFTTDSKYVDFPFKVKSSAMKILTAEKQLIDAKFAYYIMQTIEHDHDTHKRYWISEYGKKVIGLPPLKEQLKIVETIEDLFGLLD